MKKLINGLGAASLLVAVPATAAGAAVRPGAAVPVAGSTSATAALVADENGSIGSNYSWIAIAGVATIVLIALIAELGDDDDNDIPISRA